MCGGGGGSGDGDRDTRNEKALKELKKLEERVETVKMVGNQEEALRELKKPGHGGCVRQYFTYNTLLMNLYTP